MKRFTIKRVVENPQGVFGVLLDSLDWVKGDTPFALTLERNWESNLLVITSASDGIPLNILIHSRL